MTEKNLVRIPKAFLDDHRERDLDTPEIVRETKTHYFISTDDPAFLELASDAEFYATGGVALPPPWLISSARATYRAMSAAIADL